MLESLACCCDSLTIPLRLPLSQRLELISKLEQLIWTERESSCRFGILLAKNGLGPLRLVRGRRSLAQAAGSRLDRNIHLLLDNSFFLFLLREAWRLFEARRATLSSCCSRGHSTHPANFGNLPYFYL